MLVSSCNNTQGGRQYPRGVSTVTTTQRTTVVRPGSANNGGRPAVRRTFVRNDVRRRTASQPYDGNTGGGGYYSTTGEQARTDDYPQVRRYSSFGRNY